VIEGEDDSLTKLYFNRSTYVEGDPLIYAVNNSGFRLAGLSIDIDDPIFRDTGAPGNGAYVLAVDGATDQLLQDISITGYFYSALYEHNAGHFTSRGLKITSRDMNARALDQAGTSCVDCLHDGVRVYGLAAYPISFALGTNNVLRDFRDETASSFGASFGGETKSRALSGYGKSTIHEAFNMTNCADCILDGFQADLDNTSIDFGVSFNGDNTGVQTRCIGTNIIVTGSANAGVAIANNSTGNVIENFKLYNCGLGAGSDRSVFVGAGETTPQYDGAVCAFNVFRNGDVANSSGTVPYGFVEAIAPGRTNSNNSHQNVTYSGVTNIDSFSAGSNSFAVDPPALVRTATPTLLAGTANPTGSLAVRYRRDGKRVSGSALWSITANGSATDYLAFTPPVPVKAGGTGIRRLGGAITAGSQSGIDLWAELNSGNILARATGGAYPGGSSGSSTGRFDFDYETD